MSKTRTYDYRIVIEQPRELVTKQGIEVVVDRFTTFVYGVRSVESARRIVRKRLPELRKQGLRMNLADYRKARNNLLITRV